MRLHHKILTLVLGISGVVLVWRGLWTAFDLTPFVNHPAASIVIGIIFLVLSGSVFKLL